MTISAILPDAAACFRRARRIMSDYSAYERLMLEAGLADPVVPEPESIGQRAALHSLAAKSYYERCPGGWRLTAVGKAVATGEQDAGRAATRGAP